MKEELPREKKLIGVIYIYEDGSQYKMIDVQNYLDNLESSDALVSTRGYMKMKPVNWEKINPNEVQLEKKK